MSLIFFTLFFPRFFVVEPFPLVARTAQDLLGAVIRSSVYVATWARMGAA